ncbi:nucleotidyltransferase family protein [Agrobacterium tumefaciens]|uniref:nucleotidyltransferase family protein n=1 Tax=Agrobacterium tumefaciens TaxID=358 RepID=UPI003B9E79C8
MGGGAEPTVAIVILAAGPSTRMGSSGCHKLLAEFDGMPLVRRSAYTALACQSHSVIVVTGFRDADIRDAIAGLGVQTAYNGDYLSGIASSIGRGVKAAARGEPDGIMVMLADMPALDVAALDCLIGEFRKARGPAIVRAVARGIPGNPVIFPRVEYERLCALGGDEGARKLIAASQLSVIDVEIGEGAAIDVDTPDQILAAGGIIA